MAFPLDLEQRIAVETEGVSLVVTAGAGCGKTGTITARFLHLLGKREPDGTLAEPAERAPLGRIGVLTFTNKAAAELRHRIRKACDEEASLAISPEDAEYWRSVAFAMEGVTISTYHSLYEQLCREFAEQLDLDPDARLLDDRIATGLKREAAREAVRERLSSGDPVLIEYAARHRLDAVVEQLVELIGKGNHQTRVSQIADMEPETLASNWFKSWKRAVKETANALEQVLNDIFLLPREGFTENWLGNMAKASEAMMLAKPDRIGGLIQSASFLVGNAPKRKDLQEKLGILKTIKTSEPYGLMQANPKLLENAAVETILLARLTQTTKLKYADLKSPRRAVDFDDLVEKASELTQRGIPLGGKYLTKFDTLLVDEFQDTDRLQSDILKSLAGNPFDTGQLFVVGDVKQAIYRFRGADPDALLRLRAEMPEEGQLNLMRNYRSCKQIVDFVNLLKDSMYNYLADDPGLMVGLTTKQALNVSVPAVHFLWTVPKPKPKDEQAVQESKDEDEVGHEQHRAEAKAVAQKLRDLIDQGLMVGAKNLKGETWKADSKDIVFITRSRSKWWVYEQALRNQGFEVHQDSVGAFFQSQEIRDLINFLAVIENRMDDVRLAAALRGPLFNISDEALFAVAQLESGTTLADRFWRSDLAETPLIDVTDQQILKRAKDLILAMAELKAVVEPSEIVKRVIFETEFEAIVRSTAEEPEQACANLEKLVDEARTFDHDPDFGWPSMIRQWLADLTHFAKAEEAVVDAPKDKIRFLTIHSAKGLEFPVVVMPGLQSAGNNRTGPFMIHPEQGLITRSRTSDTDEAEPDDHPAWLTGKLATKVVEEKEDDNLLYVAVTRAMDHLILSAFFDPTATTAAGEPVKPRGPFLKRLAQAFNLTSGKPLNDFNTGSPLIDVSRISSEVKV